MENENSQSSFQNDMEMSMKNKVNYELSLVLQENKLPIYKKKCFLNIFCFSPLFLLNHGKATVNVLSKKYICLYFASLQTRIASSLHIIQISMFLNSVIPMTAWES